MGPPKLWLYAMGWAGWCINESPEGWPTLRKVYLSSIVVETFMMVRITRFENYLWPSWWKACGCNSTFSFTGIINKVWTLQQREAFMVQRASNDRCGKNSLRKIVLFIWERQYSCKRGHSFQMIITTLSTKRKYYLTNCLYKTQI